MARLLIQSTVDFQFLHWSPVSGSVAWTPSFHQAAAYGLIEEEEQVQQLVDDYCDRGCWILIDLDNLPVAR